MAVRRFLAGVVALMATIALLVAPPVGEAAQAAPAGAFNAEYLISDANFRDAYSMSEADIQAFFSRTPCTPHDGVPCLANYRQTTQNRADAGANQCRAYTGEANESAARIIAKVSQACGISPKVLIVLVQKEQSLVTSPSARGYQYATGANCPDTPQGCDPAFSGFFIQIYSAAWQFRQYAKYPNAWNYKVGNSFVQYHPNRACGGSTLNLRNQATASLYIYTPYQPNPAALANLYGSGDGCSSYGNRNFWRTYFDWFGSPTESSPIGSIDAVSPKPGGVQVSGWTLDYDTRDPLIVHAYVDGAFATGFGADQSRPDVDARYALGASHGFSATIPLGPGDHRVCLYAINVGSGSNTELTCRTMRPASGDPFGALDGVVSQPGGFRVDGWAIDRDTADSILVHVYVDDRFAGGYGANGTRGDVAAAFPGYGSSHGYSVGIGASPGSHRVCAYAMNVLSGSSNTQLGCSTVVVGGDPIGAVTRTAAGLQQIDVSGWAIDPDTTNPIWLHAYLDGVFAAGAYANLPRDDLGAYQAFGATHGFELSLKAGNGRHRVCLYALNTGSGTANTQIGCETVTVGGDPAGALEAVQAGFGSATVSGWAYDPDVADPIDVHVYVDGRFTTWSRAQGTRADVSALPGPYGDDHGYSATFAVAPGARSVCVYAINTGTGSVNTQLGCTSVTIAGQPVGAIENVQTVGAGYGVYGYAVDPDTAGPIFVHIYVDGAFAGGYAADQFRPDLETAFPGYGGNHAYGAMVPASAGSHQVCVYAINTPSGPNPNLGCVTVVRR